MNELHPIDEWEMHQTMPLPELYDNRDNLRISRTQLTFTGYDDLKIIFRKSNRRGGGLSVKFAEFGGKSKKKWLWLWEHFSPEECTRIGKFLLSMSDTPKEPAHDQA